MRSTRPKKICDNVQTDFYANEPFFLWQHSSSSSKLKTTDSSHLDQNIISAGRKDTSSSSFKCLEAELNPKSDQMSDPQKDEIFELATVVSDNFNRRSILLIETMDSKCNERVEMVHDFMDQMDKNEDKMYCI